MSHDSPTRGSEPDERVYYDRRLDELLAALASVERRAALRVVAAREDPVPLADLAADVARDLTRFEPGQDETARVSQLTQRLHHVHLPTLEDAHLVTYDAEARLVRATARLDSPRQPGDRLALRSLLPMDP